MKDLILFVKDIFEMGKGGGAGGGGTNSFKWKTYFVKWVSSNERHILWKTYIKRGGFWVHS